MDKVPIIIAGGSFNAKTRKTIVSDEGIKTIRELIDRIDPKKVYFVIGHKVEGYEKELVRIAKESKKEIEIDAIIPKLISEESKNKLLDNGIHGVCISIEMQGFGIYKSFNYEIFERRSSIVIALDGNSPVSNLVQEAKNGKGTSKIYIDENIPVLKQKAYSLGGYVIPFNLEQGIIEKIIEDNPEII